MNADAIMIRAIGLTRRFGALTALDRLNLEIPRGEIFGLVGPDGAGKTTTVRLLCGLLDPTEGRVEVAGHDVARSPDAVKDRIGYMAQRFGLYVDLTVEENMRFYADLFGVTGADRDQLMARLLRMTRMDPFRARQAGKLSGGMKQKLALMCTLMHHPQVLFLVEPTNGVDPVSRRDFWAILYQLVKDGLTVFVTTAYLDEAERCHRVALLHQGRLLFCDTPAALKQNLPGAVISIVSADPRQVRETLEKAEGISSLVLVGSGVHLVVDDAARRIPELRARLEGSGASFEVIEQITPTIEDLFVAAVQGGIAGKQP